MDTNTMDVKTIAVWVVVALLVGVGGYYGYKYLSPSSESPAGTQTAQTSEQTKTPPEQVQGQEVTVGTGEEAKPGMVVTVEYVGKLTDGTVFDSSEGKQPLVFTLGAQGIIPGFQVGVNGMKVGGERILAIPPSLGYGDEPRRKDPTDPASPIIIPAKSTLIFTVKLLKVEAPAPSAAATAEPTAAPAAQ